MPIHVKLSTTLRDQVAGYNAHEGLYVNVDEGDTALDIAQKLALSLADIKIVMLNGQHASLESALKDGDRVAFFPAVGGG